MTKSRLQALLLVLCGTIITLGIQNIAFSQEMPIAKPENISSQDSSAYVPSIVSDQYWSIGLLGGTSHYFGDLSAGASMFGNDLRLTGGAFGFEVSKRYLRRLSLRSSLLWVRIMGDDYLSNDAGSAAYNRNLHFRNDLVELSLSGQIDLFPHYEHFKERPFFTPYIFGGFNVISHNPEAKTNDEFGNIWVPLQPLKTEGTLYPSFALGLQYGLGVNFKVSDRVDIGLEVGPRFVMTTDYIDDVSDKYISSNNNRNELSYVLSDRSMENYSYFTRSKRELPNEAVSIAGEQRGTSDDYDGYWVTTFKLKYIISKNKHRTELSKVHNINSTTDFDENPWLFHWRASGAAFDVGDFSHYQDRFTIKPLAINTEYSESMPAFYQGGLLYTSEKLAGKYLRKHKRKLYYNFFYSPIHDIFRNEINRPVVIESEDLHPYHHESGITIDNEKAVISVCERDNPHEETQHYRLYEVDIVGENKWVHPIPLPFNSNDYSISQPALTDEGNTLYFVSDMPGGNGGTDIYVSYKHKGQWTYPINLGHPVNTPGNELSPFIHEDGTLYFASDGHPSVGGLDLFEAVPDEEGFSKVVNLGVPINSPEDDFKLILNPVKREGFFTSNRKGGKGGTDIYHLQIEKLPTSRLLTGMKSELVEIIDMKLNGTVRKKGRDTLVPKALVTLTNLLDDTRQIQRTDETGKFSFNIKNEGFYQINASASGFKRMVPIEISTLGIKDQEELIHDIEMTPVNYRLYVKGALTDKESKEILPNIEVTLMDLHDDTQTKQKTNSKGEYKFKLEQDKSYILFVSEKGYEHKNYEVSTFNKHFSQTMRMDIKLTYIGENNNAANPE